MLFLYDYPHLPFSGNVTLLFFFPSFQNREDIRVRDLVNVDGAQLLREAKADGIEKRNFIANLLY